MMSIGIECVLFLLAPVFLLCIALEAWYCKRKGFTQIYRWQDSMCNICLSLLHQGSDKLAWFFIIPLYQFVYDHYRLFTFSNTIGSFIALFLLQDFFYYWFHRASHRIRWLWAAHSVHHSSTYMNLSTAFRQSFMYPIAGMWIFWLPIVWLGFSPNHVLAIVLFNLAFQFFVHTQIVPKLGRLEWLLNTPSIHRSHHARNARYIDHNYAGVLVIWDRLFGTYVEEYDEEPCAYGTVKPVISANPLIVSLIEWYDMFAELIRAQSFRQRLMILFGPPEAAETLTTSTEREGNAHDIKHM